MQLKPALELEIADEVGIATTEFASKDYSAATVSATNGELKEEAE